jgi:hypothetical protein
VSQTGARTCSGIRLSKGSLVNEQMLLSFKRDQELTEADIVGLKAFGLRDLTCRRP